ncbi:L,D-transpeptidase family protein [Vreelandella malpeensis]|uniref:L,D-transpeptidase family protein n=1 Tax=Vreelandella malpeensis TaxID=1172368 RepID=A0ABS8DNE4_9GAMM|nr:L,D-transpeptidase family protein [Halomonas malpeensis]MCB8887800.1 L,D-transpeptidase family protein [Halomonas malpeensis]
MNENLPIKKWAVSAVFTLALMPLPQAIQQAHADALTQQALSRQISATASDALPVAEFYQLRDGEPVWQDTAQVEALASALAALDADGLTPSDYRAASLLDEYRLSRQAGSDAEARFDVDATRRLLLALDHLSRGKVDPLSLNTHWDGERPGRGYSLMQVRHALERGDVAAAFEAARPATPAYRELRQALVEYRALERQGATARYLEGRSESLRPGDRGDDVVVLRERLALWGEGGLVAADDDAYPMIDAVARSTATSSDSRYFDAELESAVKRFQRRHQLQADGVVGNNTRLALNASIRQRIDQLRINLERARWMAPFENEGSRVWVDIAGYTLHYVRPDGQQWDARVVVGSPGRATPIIHSAISHLTINPSWTIPPTILREDVLPRVRNDASYLSQRNIQVVSPAGDRLDPASIDWQRPGGVMLRQVAGSGNPLGRVVVRFPNNDMIYLHDTPAQGAFGRSQRALSSGCIRVEGIGELAQLLLRDSGSQHQVSTLMSRSASDQNVNLPRRIPVMLHYMTAWPNAAGEVEFRDDIYRHDAALLSALDRAV